MDRKTHLWLCLKQNVKQQQILESLGSQRIIIIHIKPLCVIQQVGLKKGHAYTLYEPR